MGATGQPAISALSGEKKEGREGGDDWRYLMKKSGTTMNELK